MNDNLIHKVNDEHHKIFCDCGCNQYISIWDEGDDTIELLAGFEDNRGFFRRVWDAALNRPTLCGDVVIRRDQLPQITNLFNELGNR